MKFFLPLFILLSLVVSCVPSIESARTNRLTQKADEGDASTQQGGKSNPDEKEVVEPDYDESTKLYWQNAGQSIEGVIQIPDTFSSVIYLRGKPLHDFLLGQSSSTTSYCLVIPFQNPLGADQFRVRAAPISFNNFQTGQKEWLLRLDMNLSSSECSGQVGKLVGQNLNRLHFVSSLEAYMATNNPANSFLSKGIYKINSGTFSTFGLANGITNPSVYDVVKSGTTMIAASDGGVAKSIDSGATFSMATVADGLPSNQVRSVHLNGALVVVGTQAGIALSEDTATTFTTITGLTSPIRDAWIDAGKTVIVAATSTGTSLSTFGGAWSAWGNMNGITGLPYHIYEYGGSIYISTTTGVFQYTTAGLTTATNPSAIYMSGVSVNSTFRDANFVLFSTNQGLYISEDGGVTTNQITTANGLSENTINDAIALSSSSILAISGTSLYSISRTSANNYSVSKVSAGTYTTTLSQLCTDANCNSVTSNDIKLYQVQSSAISNDTEVSLLNPHLRNDLSMVVKMSIEDTDIGSSCSTSACNAKGFDCCLDYQCVNDGAERPNAAAQTNYSQATSEVSQNPMAFLNYPNIYYVCSNASDPLPPVDTDPTNPPADGQERLEALKKQFSCLDTVKNSPDSLDLDYSNCEDQDGDAASGVTDYDIIRKEVWVMCGCKASVISESTCPNYGLAATYDSSNNITAVSCYAPSAQLNDVPFQELNISLEANTAPHRFFRSDTNTSVDDVSTLDSSVTPEGALFTYIDPVSKSGPSTDQFSMNAVLGQFYVSLNDARPSKVVNVEYGVDYIIATTNGFFTPCPTCPNDSWFSTFSSFPSTNDGKGLQSWGYSTRRDAFDLNSTYGNYEDTIFGRACWLPPTMIPFTHKPEGDVGTQRQNRLAAQAALYINGYQRDWYGFNKGAVIGSFDGVTWFAVGTGRTVTATSEKLFLAVNAPFADLNSKNGMTVSVHANLGDSGVASADYHHDLSRNHPLQNQAGSCQAEHMCDNDIDCVTKLGWEYTCADVSTFRTSLPRFSLEANEEQGLEHARSSFEDIIFGSQGALQLSNKRCVYRGMGAICKTNFDSDFTNEKDKKLFQCAPNFYCEDIDNANAFNSLIARETNPARQHLYGQEGNVLGRPLNYVGASTSLTATIIENLKYNTRSYSTTASVNTQLEDHLGLCRPGKSLDTTLTSTEGYHSAAKDADLKTDFINQIASCDSTAESANRVKSCPIFNMDETDDTNFGNYINSAALPTSGAAPASLSADPGVAYHAQNMCGGEIRKEEDTTESLFTEIESAALSVSLSTVLPTLAADACLRRAGSPCHSDLDCAPNRMHEEQAYFYDDISKFFYNNAELSYWKESLVCGQKKKKPYITDPDFFDYDITENRCCREIGNDFTMYSQIDDVTDFVPDMTEEDENILVSETPYLDPTDIDNSKKYYSRYATMGSDFIAPVVTKGAVPASNQWKTFNDTGEKNCCGGGWIRKFADGTHDWKNFKRLNLNYENFSCLNYHSKIYNEKPANVSQFNYNRYMNQSCFASSKDGCIQTDFQKEKVPNNSNGIIAPKVLTIENEEPGLAPADVTGTAILKILPASNICSSGDFTNADLWNVDRFSPLIPPYSYAKNGYPLPPFPCLRNGSTTVAGTTYKLNVTSFLLPPWIDPGVNPPAVQPTSIKKVYLNFLDNEGSVLESKMEVASYSTNAAFCTPEDLSNAFSMDATNASSAWCVSAEDTVNNNGNVLIVVVGENETLTDTSAWTVASLEVVYTVPGHATHVDANDQKGLDSGNDLYYLTKLGKFELLGIPQITYDPLYCNSDYDTLVPELYRDESSGNFLTLRTEFEDATVGSTTGGFDLGSNPEDVYGDGEENSGSDAGNSANFVTDQGNIAHDAIFSSHDFTCCLELGNETDSSQKCCSNFSVENGGKTTCALPIGTNLSVYFNKFVSSEGMGEGLPLGGLEEDDFVPLTGEPKLSSEVNNKLMALGQAYCSTGNVRRGAAFGYFAPQPNNGTLLSNDQNTFPYSIVDSPADFDQLNDTGAQRFTDGFHWDHQFYCDQ